MASTPTKTQSLQWRNSWQLLPAEWRAQIRYYCLFADRDVYAAVFSD